MRSWTLPVLLAFPLAMLLLAARFFSSQLHYDSALVGLMGQSFLEGSFFPFFFGNNYMGTADALLAAPLLALFGPSTLALTIWPPLLHLGTMAALYPVLKRLFSPAGVAGALLWLAVPPAYFLFFAGEARTHYGLGLLLCALLLWQTALLWEERRKGLSIGRLFAWGLLAGLAFWTNFLSAQAIAPAGLLLLAAGRRGWRLSGLGWLALGVFLGAAPLLAFNLLNGWPHLGLSGSFRLGPASGVAAPFGWEQAAGYLNALWEIGLPILLGIKSPHQGAAAASGWETALFLAALAGLVLGAVLLAGKARRGQTRYAILPLAVAFLSLAGVVLTHYGSQVAQGRPRYLLWLLLALPFFWGALVEAAWRWRKAVGLALLALAAFAHLDSYRDFKSLWGRPVLSKQGGFYFRQEPEIKKRLAGLGKLGVSHLYAHQRQGTPFEHEPRPGAYVLDFLSGSGLAVVDLWRDKRPLAAARVDAAAGPAFWWKPLAGPARFLGLPYKVHQDEVLHSFGPAPPSGRLHSLAGWRAALLDGTPLGDALWDLNRRTAFVADRLPGKDGFVMDLGRTLEVSGLALFPTVWHETPRGLSLQGAGEDGRFQELTRTDSYGLPFYLSGGRPYLKARYGRVEAYFQPRGLRYLKVAGLPRHRGQVWSVKEILLFAPHQEKGPGWQESLDLALKLVRRHGVKRLYADAWPSAAARLRLGKRIWTLPPNHYTDPYGGSHPDPAHPLLVDLGPGSALLIRQRNADLVHGSLLAHGVRHRRLPAGRFALFLFLGRGPMKPLAIARASSPQNPEQAARLARGLPPGGRWSTGAPQKPGQYLQLDLGQERRLAWLELSNPHFHADYPRGLYAQISRDGKSWQPVRLRLAGPLAFSGQYLYLAHGGQNLYQLPDQHRARHLRLVLDREAPNRWWSVQKATLYAP